jgi:hypothetical protein
MEYKKELHNLKQKYDSLIEELQQILLLQSIKDLPKEIDEEGYTWVSIVRDSLMYKKYEECYGLIDSDSYRIEEHFCYSLMERKIDADDWNNI